MKKILFIIPFLVVALFHAQSLTNTENYIYSRTYLEPVTSEKPNAAQIQGVQYFDGLGRATQNIAIKATPTGKDLAVSVGYDPSGRKTKDYLPQPVDSQNGAFIPGIGENSVNAYYGVPNAYSEVLYEKSPLGRIQKAAAPEADWQMSGTHTQKMEYLSNDAGEVKKFKAVTTWNPSAQINDVSVAPVLDDPYTTNGYYNANTLYKMVTKDEDNNETHSFINSKKQALLVRKINKKPNGTTENLDTYYVYNEFDNIAFVIPPKASASALTTSLLNGLCYQYKYDKYNRLVEKKLPGKGWEYVIYDNQGRAVLSQDANLRTTTNNFAKRGWMFTKYDQFGRSVYTGFFANTAERPAMQTALNNMSANANNNETPSTTPFSLNGIDVYYTKTAFPTGSMTILGVNYYDEYPVGAPSQPSQIQNQPVLASVPTTIVSNGLSSVRSTKTFPTASYTKNIENDNWSSAFIWYDTSGRVVGAYGKNHLGGFTRTEVILDFSGKTKESYTYHSKNTSSAQVTIKDRYTYSPQNFLLKHYQQIGANMEELLSDYTYNDLGQIINKKVGNNLQSIEYTYNIKGWLTGINPNEIGNLGNKLFAYKIKYTQREGAEIPNNDYPDLKVKPKYDGSITEVDWKTANDNILRRYGYSYDGTNRLRAGFYQTEANPYLKEYNEILDYDLGGNITTLKRTSNSSSGTAITIDNLAYSYDGGNRLTNVSDSSQNYAGYPSSSGTLIEYDDNGNMTSQKDKGITKIKYNHLDLPSSVIYDATYIIRDPFFGDTEKNVNTQYTYRADGTKLKAEYSYFSSKSQIELKKITEYLDGFQYENDVLQFSSNNEGYFDFTQNKYIYNYVDHLGNVRLSYTKSETGSAAIIEESNYYPLGLRHAGYNSPPALRPYHKQYNGKEIQESGMLDYGWRNYMPEIGRWGVMDQLSESYISTSPYAYVLNNPVNMFDPDGRMTAAFTLGIMHFASGTTFYNNNDDTWSINGGSMAVDNNGVLIKSHSSGGGGGLSGGDALGTIYIPEVIVNGKKGKGFGEGTFNGAAMYSGILGALQDLNTQRAMSAWQTAINETEIGKSIGSLEKFLFLEIPMSFAGGELLSAGWRASGIGQYLCGPIGRLTNGLIKICFTEGTLVAAEKDSKKIEDIKEGDLVWSYNEETGKKELKKVVELSRNTSSSLVKISVNGTEITCTPEHPFYVNGNWIEAKDLNKGMLLTTLDGATFPVESIIFLDEKVKVFNFEVEGNHNYYVSEKGILVHNDCGFLDSLLEKIVSINRATEGGGVLLNGTPSSAVNSAMYYETAAEQGASIFRSISGGHMFMDGNKRTAVEVFKYFAEKNGLNTVSHAEMMNVSNQVATGQLSDIYQISRMLIK